MIASLRGTLAEAGPGACVIDVAGIGYHVHVSTHTAATLPAPGGEVFLRTRQVVREDALTLFGFADAEELELFDLAIGVSGVGPRLALALLSGLAPRALARAIRREETAALVAVPGIGRKTAERLIVELRDKIQLPAGEAPARAESRRPTPGPFEDAVAALTRLGYTASQSRDAVRVAADVSEADATLEQLVRRALARLGKGAGTVSGPAR
jgi:Holliday junction DNA helicase RuvA